ncbi:MAG: hypothetical protein RL757_1155, partial [Bacteroidota bacterium]
MKKLLLLFQTLLLLCCVRSLNAQSNFIRQDSIFVQSQDCAGGIAMCIDSITYEDIDNFRFYLDGVPFAGAFNPCRIDTIHAYSYLVLFQDGERGPFRLDSWAVNSRTFSMFFPNLNVLRDSMNRWDRSGNWQLDSAAQLIYGIASGGTTYGCQNIVGLTRGGRNQVCYNPGLLYRGLRFRAPVGVHFFIAENRLTGDRDTVKLYAACVAPDTVRRTVTLGGSGTYCVDASQLLGSIQPTRNFCARTTSFATFQTPSGICISYNGTAVGQDTACLRFCDQFGVCDTTYLIVNVVRDSTPPVFGQTFRINNEVFVDSTLIRCSVSRLTRIQSVTNICATPSRMTVSFNRLTNCLTVRGITAGTDSVCYRICDSAGVCDTIRYTVTVRPNAPLVGTTVRYNDTIFVDSTVFRCSFTRFTRPASVTSLCGMPTRVTFSLNPVDRCATVRGLSVGTDSVCLRICDSSGICDTVYYRVVVRQNTPPPVSGQVFRLSNEVFVDSTLIRCSFSRLTRIQSVTNICATPSRMTAVFNPLTNCVTVRGITQGIDSICFRVCDSTGVCDTIRYTVTVRPNPIIVPTAGQTFRLSNEVFVDSTLIRCSFSRLTRIQSVTNICATPSRMTAVFNPLTNCVTVRGITVGMDSICFRVCDS